MTAKPVKRTRRQSRRSSAGVRRAVRAYMRGSSELPVVELREDGVMVLQRRRGRGRLA